LNKQQETQRTHRTQNNTATHTLQQTKEPNTQNRNTQDTRKY